MPRDVRVWTTQEGRLSDGNKRMMVGCGHWNLVLLTERLFELYVVDRIKRTVVTRVGEEIRRGATQPEPRDVAAERNSNVERGTFRQKSEEGISKDATRVVTCTTEVHPRSVTPARKEVRSRPQTTPIAKNFLDSPSSTQVRRLASKLALALERKTTTAHLCPLPLALTVVLLLAEA